MKPLNKCKESWRRRMLKSRPMQIRTIRLASNQRRNNRTKKSKTKKKCRRLRSSSRIRLRMKPRISRRRIRLILALKMKSWNRKRSKRISKTSSKTTKTSLIPNRTIHAQRKKNTKWKLTQSQLSLKLLNPMTSSITSKKKSRIGNSTTYGKMTKKSTRMQLPCSVGSRVRLEQLLPVSVSS